MEKMRFGLVGYGKVAELHARAIAASGNSVLVAVCGRDPQKREAFALRHGISARGSIGEMVARDRVEAVLIVTPHPSHGRSPSRPQRPAATSSSKSRWPSRSRTATP